MRKLIFLLFFTQISFSLFACLSASQNRIFPLGLTSRGLCVVETHLFRTDSEDKGKLTPAWEGISYFKIYDSNYFEVYSEIIDKIKLFKQIHYESNLFATFSKGFKIAEKYPDFVPAQPISITFCDYQEECSLAKLVYDSINNKVSIQLINKVNYEIKYILDTTSIASSTINHFNNFDQTLNSVKPLIGNLYINSIRQFKIGNQKLIVIHIETGEVFESIDGVKYPPGKEYQANFVFNDLTKSTFEEPVLHHGKGFDFYIWE